MYLGIVHGYLTVPERNIGRGHSLTISRTSDKIGLGNRNVIAAAP